MVPATKHLTKLMERNLQRTLAIIFSIILASQLISHITFDLLPYSSPKPKEEKIWQILYWTPIFGSYKQWGLGLKCQSCYGTTNRELLNVSDVVYFHYRDLNENDLPKFRKPNQIYIVLNMESPPHSRYNPRYKYFFNWTAHYRHDSNLFYSYGRVYAHDKNMEHSVKRPWLLDSTDFEIPKPNLTAIEHAANMNKTRSVVWIDSNCNTAIKREEYVKQLSSYINVDIYGACGDTVQCPRSEHAKCMKMIENKYMFYIAFENSLCLDYITEKLYNALQLFIVPIVMGGADYQRAAPPNSYINVQDYKSLEDLAKYLHYLQENRTAYNQYFEWKKYYTITGSGEFGVCAECAAIKNHLVLKKSSMVDLEEFYNMKQCRSKL